MYQALYRKYRPRSFSDVTGQDHITHTLREQMKSDRLSHAYLFVGTRGTGKTTCAKILSRVVNCETPIDGDACNKCISCIGIENGSILDVLELDAASNNGVDNIRAIREEAIYTPAHVKKRIYIIDEVHMLTTSAFNALLKILEEPPEHLIFILATTELHKVPATIMSRCQRFMFRRISPDAIEARLKKIAVDENITLTDDAGKKLASLADGSMRDGISLFDQCATGVTIDIERVLDTLGLVGTEQISRLASAIADRNLTLTLSILDELYNNGRDMVSLLNELGALMRDLLVYKLSPKSPLIAPGRDLSEIKVLSDKLSSSRLFFNLELVREAVYSLSRGSSIRLTTEMCLIRMCEERLSNDVSAILSRLENLEFRIENGELSPIPSSFRNVNVGKESAPSEIPVEASVYPYPAQSEATTLPPVTEVFSESEKEREADVEPIPEVTPDSTSNPADVTVPEHLQPDESNSTFWDEILKYLENQPSIHSAISNKDRIWAEYKEGFLTIYVDDQFKVNQLEMDMFINPLKDAALRVFERDVIIRVELGVQNEKKESATDKLEALRAFSNVQFE